VGGWYWPTWWTLWAAGFLPALYFVLTWRPKQRNLLALDVGGWVAVVLLAYARSAALVLLGAERPSVGRAIAGHVFGVLIAALLIVRALNWHQVRRAWPRPDDPPDHPLRRADDHRGAPPDPAGG
jgi:hypothetical protein